MLDQINWVFHVFFMLFFFVLAAVLLLIARRERGGWLKVSAQTKLIYEERKSQRIQPFVSRFALLGASVVQAPSEVLAGTRKERELILFNWFFQSSSSLNAVRCGFACVLVSLNKKILPVQCYDKSLAGFGGNQSEYQMVLTDEPFMDRYTLFHKDRKAAEHFCSAELVTFLLSEPWWLELKGEWLFLGKQGVWEPEDIVELLAKLDHLLGLIESKA